MSRIRQGAPGLGEMEIRQAVASAKLRPAEATLLAAFLEQEPSAVTTWVPHGPAALARVLYEIALAGHGDKVAAPICAGCGRGGLKLSAQRPEGAVCYSCLRPHRACSACGEQALTIAATESGPVCRRCYRPPARVCGGCGREAPKALPGARLCRACQDRPARVCADCGRSRPSMANWPVGPLCDTCYCRRRRNPVVCGICGEVRIAAGRTSSGSAACGPCTGRPELHATCARCKFPGDLYTAGLCARCVLGDRVDELLAPARGQAARQLRPLAEALGAATHPRSVLAWLHRHSAAALLAGLAAEGQAITHEMLDRLPRMKSTRYVRELLVGTGVLPARQENLARLEAWTSTFIGALPAGQARLVGPYARWHIVRDARRRAARRPYSSRAADADVRGIRIAAAFTAWLDQEGLGLAELTQADLDRYLSEHPTKHRGTRAFIRWAIIRRLTDKHLTAAAPRWPFPSDFLDTDELDAQLSRCLNDTGLPREVRIAGVLSRLYALPLTRIVTLTADHYTQEADGHGYLTLERNPVLLPPKLARLIQEQIIAAASTSMISPHPASPPFLMPGKVPGRHRSLNWFYTQMHEHGLPVRPARNTAMIEAVTRLPSIVVADLFGIHPGTADSWARYANASWAAHLAARREDDGRTVRSTDTARLHEPNAADGE
ncbi:XRE family transcriptional regulator [Streptomyces sp. DH8]|uniref:XRE family transcriptional regulator n=1 Tax=Streptomyces sp. DH8 TaxID=2857008 RepID=UPI001E55FB46|nr:XRE family transcriptional regulator [Streptomyces sp. DH8]